jgi:CO/xanthine dehydrogenase FAD-binding subunit
MREHIRYLRPATVDEAVKFLSENAGRAAVINGGTDMMIDVRSGKFTGDCLVDVSGIPELREIREEGDAVSIGAGVTIEKMAASSLLREKLPAMAQAGINFAGRQIRNSATIGGNVAHASPSGDTQPSLVLYDGTAVVAGPAGERQTPVGGLFAGANKSALGVSDVIVRFILKPHKAKFQCFEKIGRRKDLAISRVSLALLMDFDSSGAFSEARVSLGACKPTTGRMPKTEAFFLGKKPSLAVFRAAAKVLSSEMIETTGRRKSVFYKEPAIEGLLVRMLLPLL